jgi:hypothetical protein
MADQRTPKHEPPISPKKDEPPPWPPADALQAARLPETIREPLWLKLKRRLKS